MSDVCTMTYSSLNNAIIETINSTAFLFFSGKLAIVNLYHHAIDTYPNVALSKPPIVSPVRKAISSVALLSIAARGLSCTSAKTEIGNQTNTLESPYMIAKKFTTKTAIELTWA